MPAGGWLLNLGFAGGVAAPGALAQFRGVGLGFNERIAGTFRQRNAGHDTIELDFADVGLGMSEGVIVWYPTLHSVDVLLQFFRQTLPMRDSIEAETFMPGHSARDSIEIGIEVSHHGIDGLIQRLFRQSLRMREQIVVAAVFRLYKNTADGGPVDLTTVFLETTSTTIVTSALAVNFHHRFIVRRFNGIFEDRNTAETNLRIDAGGFESDLIPGVPLFDARGAGDFEIDIDGEYRPGSGEGVEPDTFELYWNAGSGPVLFVTPISSQAIQLNDTTKVAPFQFRQTGLTPATTYDFVLRTEVTGGADSGNTAPVSVDVPGIPPPPSISGPPFDGA